MRGTQLFLSPHAAGLIDLRARRLMTHMSVPAYQGASWTAGARHGFLLSPAIMGVRVK